MKSKKYVLGIDTSNYKTSVAAVDLDGNIAVDIRELLQVKQGERGLRQSDALFQHVNRLPELLTRLFSRIPRESICAVAVSVKPRPVPGSYMPVFNAGKSAAYIAAAALDVPVYEFSHQEGHIEAIRRNSGVTDTNEYLAYHLSGGTCELLRVKPDDIAGSVEIIGGSKDISFGQLIDRIGVRLGLTFPAGEEMDKLAMSADTMTDVLGKISINKLYFNLSGIETQCLRFIDTNESNIDVASFAREIFHKSAAALTELTCKAAEETGISKIIFSGGVSGSEYISSYILKADGLKGITIEFGDKGLSQDNAVGTAMLGGKAYVNETR